MLLAAFGDPGHAFPMIALGRELAARGHEVILQTWQRWEEHAEREGMRFLRAPEYQVFPTLESPMKPYAAGVRAAKETQPLMRELDPDVVVADILTVAAALAAQAEERPWVTLVPHVIPWGEPSFPPYSMGAVRARTAIGARLWALTRPVLMAGERQGRRELNGARERIGLPPLDYVQGGMSRLLSLIATFPQLEYPREHPLPWARITGPLLWEQPYGEVELPSGDDPLVLVAPSTSQDREHRLLRAALEGLAREPVRILATTNRRDPGGALVVPANAKVVDWVSYARTMPKCDAVICHAGHGTLARALASGVPLVACPSEGDMAENAARVRWAGVGVSLPRRLQTPRGVRLALRRLLGDPEYAHRARGLGEWAARNDGAVLAADAVEEVAGANVPIGPL
jgi:UDP:flavonoid glycosyltransferase YjiC (YdhE family)